MCSVCAENDVLVLSTVVVDGDDEEEDEEDVILCGTATLPVTPCGKRTSHDKIELSKAPLKKT